MTPDIPRCIRQPLRWREIPISHSCNQQAWKKCQDGFPGSLRGLPRGCRARLQPSRAAISAFHVLGAQWPSLYKGPGSPGYNHLISARGPLASLKIRHEKPRFRASAIRVLKFASEKWPPM